MLNNLDLFKIRLINALVKSETLIGASKVMGITSSAVSQNIRSLERSLGKPLFVRVGKGVKPTVLAIEISKLANPFFSDLVEVLESSDEIVAEVRIAAPPIFGSTTLIDKIQKFRESNDSIRVVLSLLDTQRILDDLIDCKVDFGFVDNGQHIKTYKEIATTVCQSEELVMCCTHQFRKANLFQSHSLKTLKTLPHIPYHKGKEGVHKWYIHHYGRVPDLKWTFAVDHPYAVLSAILKDWGLGVLPRHLVEQYKKQIYIVHGVKKELQSQILLAQNKNKVSTRLEKTLISLLLQN
jgi:DNA-binding transcriptional LysR family regulator